MFVFGEVNLFFFELKLIWLYFLVLELFGGCVDKVLLKILFCNFELFLVCLNLLLRIFKMLSDFLNFLSLLWFGVFWYCSFCWSWCWWVGVLFVVFWLFLSIEFFVWLKGIFGLWLKGIFRLWMKGSWSFVCFEYFGCCLWGFCDIFISFRKFWCKKFICDFLWFFI